MRDTSLPASRIGHYELIEKLGEGGMGVVYKARDVRLGRVVALKVLPADRTADEDRRRRFLIEAQAASALNHPNIVGLLDIGSEDGAHYLTMEYVEGRTLADVIGRKGLKIDELLRYGESIADALTAAHQAGIIHRDLKPTNILVTRSGSIKLIDFGLARLTEQQSRDNQTTQTLCGDAVSKTDEGAIVGTVAYMSPEQAESRPVDARSDIFSLGAVLYEMATGRRAFTGDTRLSVLSAILRDEPKPLSEIAPQIPREIERVIQRCLRKDSNRRFQHMDEVRVVLRELREESDSGKLLTTVAGIQSRPRQMRRTWVVTGTVTLVLLAAAGALFWSRSKQAATPKEASLRRITADAGLTTDPALSPDGRLLVYTSDRDGGGDLELWIQQVAGGEPVRLTDNDVDDYSPDFSPDDTRIVFRSDRNGGGVYIMSALGGRPSLVAAGGRNPRFSPDGNQIAYWIGAEGSGDPLAPGASQTFTVSARGGTPRQFRPDFAVAKYPIWSSDGSSLLFFGYPASSGSSRADWYVASLTGGPAVATGTAPALTGRKISGQIFSWRGDQVLFSGGPGYKGDLWKATLSQRDFLFAGPMQRITNGSGWESGNSFDGRQVAFAVGTGKRNVWVMPLDANSGKPGGPPKQVTDEGDYVGNPCLTSDGKLLVYSTSRTGNPDVMLKNLETGSVTPVAATGDLEAFPRILPDGSAVFYDVRRSPNDRSVNVADMKTGVTRRVCDRCGVWGVSPHGEWVLGRFVGTGQTIGLTDTNTGKTIEFIKKEGARAYQPNLSDDGKWIVFLLKMGPQHGRLYVAPFRGATPIPEREWIPVTRDDTGLDKPRWSPNAQLLYYTSEKDGFRCIYAQKLDARKNPVGEAFGVYHPHSARLSMSGVPLSPLEISVAKNRIAFMLKETTGNVWLADLGAKE